MNLIEYLNKMKDFDQKGRILVNSFLQIISKINKNALFNIFAIGDCCISPLSEEKVKINLYFNFLFYFY